MGSRQGGDSLGSLLQELDGIDTRAFSKPKTLAGMKSSKPNRGTQVEATSVGLGTKEQPVISTPSTSNLPSISPAKPTYTTVEPVSTINSDTFTNVSSSTAAHIPNAPSSSQHSTDAFPDSLFTTSTATPPPSSSQNPDDIFGTIEGGASTTDNVDAFDFFGGLPPPPPPPPLPPPPSKPTPFASYNNNNNNNGGDFLADPEDLMSGFSRPTEVYENNNRNVDYGTFTTDHHHTSSSTGNHHHHHHQQQRRPSSTNKYKVFDHIDAQQDYINKHDNPPPTSSSPAASSLQPGNTHTPLSHNAPPPPAPSSPHRSNAGDKPGEILAEAGQRAARLLQTGTKWFMKKSKSIVQEVSTRIDHQRAKHGHHRDDLNVCTQTLPSSNQGGTNGGSGMQGFYYEWATQLARMSPDSRSAALCSLEEHDRMAVQLILDENSRGEDYLASSQYKEQQKQPQKKQQKQQCGNDTNAPCPPSYDHVVGGGSTSNNRKVEPTSNQDKDLLGLHTTTNNNKSTMEASLFGEDATPSGGGKKASALDSMIDLEESLGSGGGGNNTNKASGAYGDLYTSGSLAQQGQAGEPEERRILREKRLAAQAERMQRQLQEKRAREDAEIAVNQGKRDFRDVLQPKIDSWAAGKRDNIRALLSTLDQVLWKDSGWTKPSIADMVEDAKVKRVYMKANLIVHPDKVKQKGGTLEQITTADMVFDTLKVAWGKFDTGR